VSKRDKQRDKKKKKRKKKSADKFREKSEEDERRSSEFLPIATTRSEEKIARRMRNFLNIFSHLNGQVKISREERAAESGEV
jgi:hypothetical protein